MSGTSNDDSVPLFQQCSNKNALVLTETNHWEQYNNCGKPHE